MFKERTVTRDARFGGVECPHVREVRYTCLTCLEVSVCFSIQTPE